MATALANCYHLTPILGWPHRQPTSFPQPTLSTYTLNLVCYHHFPHPHFPLSLPAHAFFEKSSIFIVVSVTESSESSECSEISEVSEQISEGDLQSANPTMMPLGEWWGEKATMGICSSTRNTIFTLAVQYSTNHEGLENHEVPHASREYPVLANASKVYNSPRLRYNHFGHSVGLQPVATVPYRAVIQASIMRS